MNDKKNAIKSLQTMLRSIKYPDVSLNIKELSNGVVNEHLKIYHYLFLSFSPALASEILVKHNLELTHKGDKFFVDGIYKLARDMLEYVPKLTKDQFFQTNFATQKCQMTIDLIKLVQQKCKSFQTNERVITGGGGGASNANVGDKVVTASSSMYSLNLKSNVPNGSTGSGGSSGNASSSSSSSINSYGNMGEQNDQNSLKQSIQVKNHLSMAPPLLQTGSVITSSRIGSNIRSTKSFNSKSLTRATARRVENSNPKTPPITAATAQISQPQNDSYNNIEQTINTLANSVQSLANVIGSFEARFVNIENSIASLMGSSPSHHLQANTFTQVESNQLNSQNDKTIIRKLDNLAAKITIIETDLMLLKQLPKQQSNINNLSVNADDTASYETPFVSFSHAHNDNLNDSACNNNFMSAASNCNRVVNLDQFVMGKSKLSSMSQGVLKESDIHLDDDTNYEFNNESMMSNDSTPKFVANNNNNNKTNGFMQKFPSLNNESDAVLRAKNLVLKAVKLNTEVKI